MRKGAIIYRSALIVWAAMRAEAAALYKALNVVRIYTAERHIEAPCSKAKPRRAPSLIPCGKQTRLHDLDNFVTDQNRILDNSQLNQAVVVC